MDLNNAITGTLPGWVTYLTVMFTVVVGVLVADHFALGTLSQVVVTLVLLAVFGKTLDFILN